MNQTRSNPRQAIVNAQKGESHLNPPTTFFFSLSKHLAFSRPRPVPFGFSPARLPNLS